MAVARFWLRLASAVFGIVIQILSGWILFSTAVENQILNFVLPRIKNPQQFGLVPAPGDTVDGCSNESAVLR